MKNNNFSQDSDFKSEFEGKPLNKQNILNATKGGLLFYQYVIPGLKKFGNKMLNVKNPFYDDTKPSLSIYKEGKNWYFHDFGEPSYKGDVFNFARFFYGKEGKINFYQILKNINRDLKLGLIESEGEGIKPDFTYQKKDSENRYEIYFKPRFSQEDLNYWKQFGISEYTLNTFDVFPVKKYILSYSSGKKYTFYSKPDNPIFAYKYSNELIKIYRPFDEKYKFIWVGDISKRNYFGYSQCLNYDYRWQYDLIITGGEKDVMTLYEMEYHAMTLNSETYFNLSKKILIEIGGQFKSVIVLYDNDTTGTVMGSRLAEKYGFSVVSLPEGFGKDISEYVANGGSEEKISELIEEASERYWENPRLDSQKSLNDPKISSHEKIGSNKDLENVVELKDSEDQSANNPEVLNEDYPYICNKILDSLPKFLKEAISLFDNERQKDVIFYSSLGLISGLLPKVSGIYRGSVIYPNLFAIIIAPPASNKGVITWSKKLGEELHNFYYLEYKEALQEYHSDKKDNSEDYEEAANTDKPVRKLVFLPANSSAAAFLQLLSQNENKGILFETEADTLGETLTHDWGNYSDSLRKAFHHEAISYARKNNNELIEILEPKLSVVLSGTPGQIRAIISDVGNGLFSRFMFYYFEEKPYWENTFKNNRSYHEEFSKLGKKLGDLYQSLESLDYDIHFIFTKNQEQRFFDKFNILLNTYSNLYDNNIGATVKRLGMITFRIAMILSLLRYIDNLDNIPEELYCSENDFNTSLAIAENLLKHAILVYKILPKKDHHSGKWPEIKQRFFETLPEKFTFKEALTIADTISLKSKTAEKYINDFIKDEMIKRVKHGSYEKNF